MSGRNSKPSEGLNMSFIHTLEILPIRRWLIGQCRFNSPRASNGCVSCALNSFWKESAQKLSFSSQGAKDESKT